MMVQALVEDAGCGYRDTSAKARAVALAEHSMLLP
jgi:hypothetical protein